MKLMLAFCCLLPIIVYSQGIEFEKPDSWDVVLKKAKDEHKYIFVDCYATWCGPCKKMDADVYPNPAVGDYYNKHFINVRLQIDQTTHDDSLTKKWYAMANYLQNTYSVSVLPTFLFFDENGNAVHKISASQTAEQFVQLGMDALDSTRQYYSVVKHFQPGVLDTATLAELIKSFVYSDGTFAAKLADDYVQRLPIKALAKDNYFPIINTFHNSVGVNAKVSDWFRSIRVKDLYSARNRRLLLLYKNDSIMKQRIALLAHAFIDQLPISKWKNADIIAFSSNFITTTNDKGFVYVFHHQALVDSLLEQHGRARQMVNYYIYNQEVNPSIKAAKISEQEPNWLKIGAAISIKFGPSYAKTNVILGKATWYRFKKDWRNYAKCLVEKITDDSTVQHPPNDFLAMFLTLNSSAWDVFRYSDNKEELEAGITWANAAIRWMDEKQMAGPNYGGVLDTKANLLYKLGRKEEAIPIQEKAISYDKDNKDLIGHLNNMKLGLPTWNADENTNSH